MMVTQAIRNCHRFSHGQQTHIFSSSAYFFVHSVILINVGKVSTKLAQRKRHYLHVYATIARQVGRSVSKVKPLKYSIESVALGRQVKGVCWIDNFQWSSTKQNQVASAADNFPNIFIEEQKRSEEIQTFLAFVCHSLASAAYRLLFWDFSEICDWARKQASKLARVK